MSIQYRPITSQCLYQNLPNAARNRSIKIYKILWIDPLAKS